MRVNQTVLRAPADLAEMVGAWRDAEPQLILPGDMDPPGELRLVHAQVAALMLGGVDCHLTETPLST